MCRPAFSCNIENQLENLLHKKFSHSKEKGCMDGLEKDCMHGLEKGCMQTLEKGCMDGRKRSSFCFNLTCIFL